MRVYTCKDPSLLATSSHIKKLVMHHLLLVGDLSIVVILGEFQDVATTEYAFLFLSQKCGRIQAINHPQSALEMGQKNIEKHHPELEVYCFT